MQVSRTYSLQYVHLEHSCSFWIPPPSWIRGGWRESQTGLFLSTLSGLFSGSVAIHSLRKSSVSNSRARNRTVSGRWPRTSGPVWISSEPSLADSGQNEFKNNWWHCSQSYVIYAYYMPLHASYFCINGWLSYVVDINVISRANHQCYFTPMWYQCYISHACHISMLFHMQIINVISQPYDINVIFHMHVIYQCYFTCKS